MNHTKQPALKGLRAIVTGASSGIGAAVARELGGAGARVVVNCHRDQEAGEKIAAQVHEAGGEAIAVCADVSREADVEHLFAHACETFGGLDLLVSNAGIQQDSAVTDMSLEQWQRVIDVNLTGQFLCTREAAREFLRPGRKRGPTRCLGNIICMSSVHEEIPWAGRINYAASKGGVMLLMQSLAQELAGRGIRVNAVAPGAIRTPINREAWESEAARQDLLRLIPYARIGEVGDVARVVRWLASDESDYVVGTTVVVDGGMTLYPAFRGAG
ncbi:MAG: glucose 1-dehydrogenase [Gammaproteobacteria bacterium]|jgi:glucose 1-dehydrogenase